ncbi:hypothetical protein BV25DRAFT_803918 [Artomyces pyxidatus]|uniref:Uncharacterized protein n=1 Tax=Artomyces pyxidatus TaxID=48021 RepID=A0ACB8SX60_9AGAM|nr:hypothetical protein BV25DRAFT_803918 [Artomyces pyxidatus]
MSAMIWTVVIYGRGTLSSRACVASTWYSGPGRAGRKLMATLSVLAVPGRPPGLQTPDRCPVPPRGPKCRCNTLT